LFGHDLTKLLWHRREPFFPGFDVRLLDRDQTIFPGLNDQFGGGFRFDRPAEDGSVLECHGDIFISRGDLIVWPQDRFEEIFAGIFFTKTGKFRSNVPAFAIDFVTPETGEFSPLEEDLTPFRWISACK